MKIFKIKSYCKVNLTLKVLKRLRNGYHNINSLITFCNLHDVITIQKINSIKDKVSFSGQFRHGVDNRYNTITKTLKLFRKYKLLTNQSFKINVEKNIPHGSGLGGASSNAAHLMIFLNKKMHLQLSKKKIVKLARYIGFDTPITLEKKNTILTGKKDEILRFKQKLGLNILIVYPNIFCSTKKIYVKNKNISSSNSRFKFNNKSKKNLINFLRREGNDLQSTSIKLYPQIKRVIDLIRIQNGCYFSRITGSGSACFGIFSNVETSIFAMKLIKSKFPKYWCVISKTI